MLASIDQSSDMLTRRMPVPVTEDGLCMAAAGNDLLGPVAGKVETQRGQMRSDACMLAMFI